MASVVSSALPARRRLIRNVRRLRAVSTRINMKFHPAVSILLSLFLFITARAAEPTQSHIGHWRFSLAGLSTGDIYLKPDGHFRMVMQRTGDAKPFGDGTGTYKLVDGVLELYFDPSAPKPVRYRYVLQGNDTFILMDMQGEEKMPYKRVPETK